MLAVAIGLQWGSPSALAGDEGGVHVDPVTGGLAAGLVETFPASSEAGGRPTSDGGAHAVIDLGTELVDGFCVGINWSQTCDPETPPPDAADPVVTAGQVLAAFRRLPLPAAKLIIQPPNGRTLVNFETNFYTRQGQLTRTLTLLGQTVHLRIWPTTYTWHYGDGTTEHTTTPGHAYPHLDITHQYAEAGPVAPQLDTTYAAQYQLTNGPWHDVTGTVTIPGTPQALRVVEARPVLVG